MSVPAVFLATAFLAVGFVAVAVAFAAVVVVLAAVVFAVVVFVAVAFVAVAFVGVPVGFGVDVAAGLTGRVVTAARGGAGPCSSSYSMGRAATPETGAGLPQTSGPSCQSFWIQLAGDGSDALARGTWPKGIGRRRVGQTY